MYTAIKVARQECTELHLHHRKSSWSGVQTTELCTCTVQKLTHCQTHRSAILYLNNNNKPDTIIRDNEKETCMLIDVAISGERNVIKKGAEKILKYKDLTTEIQRM